MFMNNQGVYVVMPLCETDLVAKLQCVNKFPEDEARNIIIQIINAIEYAHNNKIVHRDLKLDNIFVSKEDSNKIYVGDWGLCSKFDKDGFLNESVGSLYYAAPEILAGKTYIGPEVDIFSMGVILYALVAGRLPWLPNKGSLPERTIRNNIQNGVFSTLEFSPDLADLIKKMLAPSTSDRITMEELKNHPFINAATEIENQETVAADIERNNSTSNGMTLN